MLLVGGQAEAGEPLRQLSRVVERISRFSGVALHVAPSGRPEQERVTNMGAVNVEVKSTDGTTVMVKDPDWPAVRVRVLAAEAGEKLETPTVNSHCVVTVTVTGDEVEAAKPVIPVKFAVRLWLPAAKATEGLAVPEELRATVASRTGLPLN
jgi:hypothetical protein